MNSFPRISQAKNHKAHYRTLLSEIQASTRQDSGDPKHGDTPDSPWGRHLIRGADPVVDHALGTIGREVDALHQAGEKVLRLAWMYSVNSLFDVAASVVIHERRNINYTRNTPGIQVGRSSGMTCRPLRR